MRWIFALAMVIFSNGYAFSQDVPPEGSVVKGTVALGRSAFALPPGDWQVVATTSGSVTVNGIARGAPVAYVYLAQIASDSTFIAAISLRAPLSSSSVSNWSDGLCDQKDTLFRDAFSGSFTLPECLLINHHTSYFRAAPPDETGRRIWEWYAKNNTKLPMTALSGAYRKYFAGDYVHMLVVVNPEMFGQAPALKSAWAESEWHPAFIKSDPARLAFVESFKKWSYVMAESAKSTLMDRKPKSAPLPSLDDLKIK